MRKYRFLILVLLGLLALTASVLVFKPSAAGESFAEISGVRRISAFHLRDEFVVPTRYADDAARILEGGRTHAVSLASADFDEDGMPDLIAGYEANGKGVATFRRGSADLLFPSAAQQKAIDEGANFPSPFAAFAPVFELPAQPDFMVAGDFDADGHFDLIAARRGDDKIFMLSGDGRGGFSASQERPLGGTLTALGADEINRRDGLTDLVVGINGDKAQVLVLESPAGAFRAEAEVFDLPVQASGFAFGQFDENFEMDLAVAGGQTLTLIYGRDRKLSLDRARPTEAAKISSQNFDFEIEAVAALDCGFQNAGCRLALLDKKNSLHFLQKSKPDGEFSPTSAVRLPSNQATENPVLVAARVSARPAADLLVADENNRQIYIVNQNPKTEEPPIASLDAASATVAVLPMRLNKDGLSDLVILREGETAPIVVLTAPNAVYTVNLTSNQSDAVAEDNVCDVDTMTPGAQCTFRAAREQANYCPQPGPNPCGRNDEIRFDLSGAEPFVIDWSPVNSSMTLTIDGYTQTGASPNTLPDGDNAVLKVQITGPGGGLGHAVRFLGTNSVVRGLAFNNFCGGTAIRLDSPEPGGGGGHIAEGNFTGTDTAGLAHAGCEGSQGILISSGNNTIGGTVPQARNLFTDNAVGVDFFGGSNTVVQGNFIGTDRNGTQGLGGGGQGVSINPGVNNTIGGTLTGARNIISGHNTDAGTGIIVQGTGANLIQGNYIGLNVSGGAVLKNNANGITTTAPNLTVGGSVPAARNVISGNGADGLLLNASNALVQGNFIGTDASGTIIDPDGVPNNGDELGNRRTGVFTCDGPACGSVSNIAIGGTAAGARNIISGNGAYGIVLGNAASNAAHLVQGNFIGTDVSGTLARGNVLDGILDASMGGTIGGATPGAGNLISGNGASGVQIAQFRNSLVQGNVIGISANGFSPLGNAQHGVYALGTVGATIGGTAAGDTNRIAYNGGDGVRVFGFGRQAAILGNSIFSNNLLGIELLDNANNNQPAPVLTSVNLNNGGATISGTLAGAANTQFRIEFFANHTCDPSGAGEGQTSIGAANVTTGGGGTANIAANFPFSVFRGNFLTATATDPMGNTSEFSACFRTAAKNFDFEGDGRTDLSIFRPPVGEWWYLRSSDTSARAVQFGSGTDRIVPADYTGDGRTDIAFWRPSSGEWFILRSEDSSFYSVPFGISGDIPAPADYDGDGKADVAVFRPSTAVWYIAQSGGGTGILQFGTSGDVPVTADYDGDARADIAIFRPSDGSWWYLRSSDAEVRATQFGSVQDKPVPADYTGDGRAEIAFWRPSTGEWFILRSEDASFYSIPFGLNGDIPAPGDYDGDGRADIAVFRSGTWYLQQSTAGIAIVQFGTAGDQPAPAAYVP